MRTTHKEKRHLNWYCPKCQEEFNDPRDLDDHECCKEKQE